MNKILLNYFIFSFLIFFIIAKISYRLNLVDLPNKRKIHSKPTSFMGGLALSLIYLLALQLFNFHYSSFNTILFISFFIALIVFIDDKYYLNIIAKLGLLTAPVLYIIFFEKIIVHQLGNYNGFVVELGKFALPFTLFSSLLLINAFNYFDGMDGVLGLTTISVLAILYFLSSDESIRLFLIIIFIPILIFLIFNFSILKLPKLFLGDSGSLLLGYIISFILIFIENQSDVHPILLAWSVSIFVYEFLSINISRIINKKGLFLAGKDHLHHLLFYKVQSIFLVNIIMFFMNIFLFLAGYYTFKLVNPITSLILFILLFLLFYLIRKNFLVKKN